ncbi:MAG: restriction endonuclease subunit S, partial [Magnetococcales bacterium]|nr:restriction endonuclease subunit S [Magnetococcales bacterium]
PLGFKRLGQLHDAFSVSTLPFRVDVVDWATTAEGFRGIIERDRVVVQHIDVMGVLPNGTTPPRGLSVDLIRWPLIPAREIFELKYGKALIESNRCAGKVPVYGTNGQCGTHNGSLFSGPGVIVGRKGQGPLGVEWCDADYWVIDTAYTLLPIRPDIDIKYSYFLIKYIGLNHLKDGTSNPTLSRETFGSQALPIPPIDHQRAIAQVLGALDDKIELNRRMNADLEAVARTLFKDWFVDFGPVRAKAEGRPAYLVPEIWDLFPDALDDEDKPVGWRNGKLGDYFEAVKGVSYKGSGLSDEGMPLHNLNSIHEGGGYKYEGIKHYTGDYGERHIVKPGDVIVANTEQGHDRLLIGFAAMVPSLFGHQGIISHHIYRLRPKESSSLTAAYLLHLLNSPEMHETVSGYANGTTVNMLPFAGVQQPQCIAPPQPLVAVFDSIAISIAIRREEMEVESRTLAQLRDLLLPKLITGEIRVRDAEKAVEAAL